MKFVNFYNCGRNLVLFKFLLILLPVLSIAEELEPRRWSHLPINSNFIGTAYAYTEAEIGFDPVLKIEDAELELDTFAAKYIRTFPFFKRTARVGVLQTYQSGRWSGRLDGVPASVKRSGWSDTFVRFAVNLYGAPPLKGKEYIAYRATQNVETILGAALSVQLPTGEYMDDKLINLGTNRFTFRPQLGVVHSRGKWSFELTGTVALYTDNNDFFNDKKLEQDPFYTLHSHLVYTFKPGVWVSASAGYDYGKRSTIDGVKKDDRRENHAWALSFGLPLNRNIGFKVGYIGTRTQKKIGVDSDTILLSATMLW